MTIIAFYHSKSYFVIQFGPNIAFWLSEPYFDIQTGAEYMYLNLIFEILFWHSNLGQISNFDIRNPILTFEFGPIIAFRCLISYFVISIGPNIAFCHSKSYFDIRTGAEYLILTFLFGRNIAIWHFKSYIHIRSRLQNIAFWHSKSYFDIRTWAKYRILTFELLLWLSNFGPIIAFRRLISYFVIWIGTNIALCHSKSYFDRISHFDILIRAEYRILVFEILHSHSN